MAGVIPVAAFTHAPIAHVARARLAAEGIHAFVFDENVASVQWLYSRAVGGAKVCVSAGDADRARSILGRDESAAVLEELAHEPLADSEDEVCPACEGNRIALSQLARRTKAASLGIGVPFVAWSSRRRCLACGHTWKPGEEGAA